MGPGAQLSMVLNTEQRMPPRSYLRGEELLAIPVAMAIVVTAINDHFLKAACPGALTGKISDFGGLFFFPFSRGTRY